MFHPQIIAANRAKLEENLGLELRESTFDEVDEALWRMKDVDFTQEGAVEALPEDLQRFIFNEAHMCKLDFRYWAQRFCKILAADKTLQPFRDMWPGQLLLLEALGEIEQEQLEREGFAKIYLAVLKARQLGITAVSEAIVAHQVMLQPNTQGVVASDHPDNTLKLYQTLGRIYDNLPGWMKPVRDAKVKAQNLHFPGISSDIVYGSGNQRTTLGQGITVDVAHITELSTWIKDCVDGLEADLYPAFMSSRKHHSLLLLETTGAGAKGNYFHDLWQASKEDEGLFNTLFIPWFMRPDWSMNSEGITIEDETLLMAGRVMRETDTVLSKDQLAWWQMKKNDMRSKDKLGLFYQEFASTSDEAFQTGFQSVFSLECRSRLRDECRRPVDVYEWLPGKKKFKVLDTDEFIADPHESKWDRKLVVWERKTLAHLYVLGVDVSYGLTGKDNSAVEVLRVGTRMKPDEQVAEFCANMSPVELADVAWVIGHIFCELPDGLPARMAVEVNPGSPGIVTQTELLRRGYPHFYRWTRPLRADGRMSVEVGWWTTKFTRPLLTDAGVHAVLKEDLLINSPALIQEMSTYVDMGDPLTGSRHYQHAPRYFDDRIMALFIAFYVAHDHDMRSVAEERRKVMEQHQAPAKDTAQFQAMDKPYEQLVAEWEDSILDSRM